MKRIGLLSDTHSFLDERVKKHLKNCDEIWHAGDIGNIEVTDELSKIAPLRAVYGNIDGTELRTIFCENLNFTIEGLKISITHIGGRPPRFAPGILSELKATKPDVFICGHSHILIAQFCPSFGGLHLNPGAAGIYGMHQVRTLMRFDISQSGVSNLEVVEIKK
jgi:putative phosphoesterase